MSCLAAGQAIEQDALLDHRARAVKRTAMCENAGCLRALLGAIIIATAKWPWADNETRQATTWGLISSVLDVNQCFLHHFREKAEYDHQNVRNCTLMPIRKNAGNCWKLPKSAGNCRNCRKCVCAQGETILHSAISWGSLWGSSWAPRGASGASPPLAPAPSPQNRRVSTNFA